MGIRNFSYARLQLDKNLPFNKPPLVTKWAKFDVNEWAGVNVEHSTDPVLYSQISYKLVEEIIFNCAHDVPDIVLIERQRARSGGGANILEWVFRVNMLESMLHALIYAKRMNERIFDATAVFSTSAQKMGSFWDPTHSEVGSDNKKPKLDYAVESKKKADAKAYRLKLLEKWIVEYNNDPVPRRINFPSKPSFPILKETKRHNISNWIYEFVSSNPDFGLTSRNINGSKINKALEKGDDLADCLLHGVTWLLWERNKMILSYEMKNSEEAAAEEANKMYSEHLKELQSLTTDPVPVPIVTPNQIPDPQPKRKPVSKNNKKQRQK